MSADRAAAAEAIADAKGIAVNSVIGNNRQEIRDTLSAAADAAERKARSEGSTDKCPRRSRHLEERPVNLIPIHR